MYGASSFTGHIRLESEAGLKLLIVPAMVSSTTRLYRDLCARFNDVMTNYCSELTPILGIASHVIYGTTEPCTVARKMMSNSSQRPAAED